MPELCSAAFAVRVHTDWVGGYLYVVFHISVTKLQVYR